MTDQKKHELLLLERNQFKYTLTKVEMFCLLLSFELYSYDELLINTLELRNAAPQPLTCTSVRKVETVALDRKLSKPSYA